MKNFKLIRLSVILMFCSFLSCDLIEKADDVSFSTTAPISFVVNETATSSNQFYSDSRVLNLSSDPEVAKYSSKIKEFKVNKITYTISGANPTSVTFSNGIIKIASNGTTLATTGTVSLSNTSETELSADANGLNELADLLLDNKQEQIQLQGTLSQTPVFFTVNFKFYLTITANAL